MAAEAEEIEAKNQELDEEIFEYEKQYTVEKDKLDDLNALASELQDGVQAKES